MVHRYRADGTYHSTLSGEDGAGRFDTPHTLFLDRRRAEPELYVADRANARIQVYDLDGRFRRAIGEGVLASPTGVAVHGDRLFIAEFKPPRLTILDGDDRLVVRLFEQPDVPEKPGWPNALGPDGSPARSNRLRPRRLNSPHAVAIDSAGNLYITEWLIGDRLTKLTPSPSPY